MCCSNMIKVSTAHQWREFDVISHNLKPSENRRNLVFKVKKRQTSGWSERNGDMRQIEPHSCNNDVVHLVAINCDDALEND